MNSNKCLSLLFFLRFVYPYDKNGRVAFIFTFASEKFKYKEDLFEVNN